MQPKSNQANPAASLRPTHGEFLFLVCCNTVIAAHAFQGDAEDAIGIQSLQ
jgi:hypothetical protein